MTKSLKTRTGKAAGSWEMMPARKVALQSEKVEFKSMTIGRSAMMKINALEGIVSSKATKARFVEFDKKGLTPAQRRAEIVKAYSRKT